MADMKKGLKATGGRLGKSLGTKGVAALGSGAMALAGGVLGAQAAAAINAYASAALNNEYPTVAFRFDVEIDGIVAAHFTEASGLEWSMDSESFREGGLNHHERRLLGPGSFTPLTLKRGFTAAGSEFFLWLKKTFELKEKLRRNVSLVILNQEGIEVGRINFKNALITKYGAPSLNATDNSVAMEEVVLEFDYFEYQPRDINEVMMESVQNLVADTLSGMIPGR